VVSSNKIVRPFSLTQAFRGRVRTEGCQPCTSLSLARHWVSRRYPRADLGEATARQNFFQAVWGLSDSIILTTPRIDITLFRL